MNYYLFSAAHRCQPCKHLVGLLDKEVPNWKEKVKYIDVDKSTKEEHELAIKLGVMKIPTLANDSEIIKPGHGYLFLLKEIKDICTKG